jgi:hypothetical protein
MVCNFLRLFPIIPVEQGIQDVCTLDPQAFVNKAWDQERPVKDSYVRGGFLVYRELCAILDAQLLPTFLKPNS